MPKGIIISIPTGSDKSLYISQLDSKDRKKWLDGDILLKDLGIKNKLNYWFTDYEGNKNTIIKINKILNKAIEKEFNIIFSGNPNKIKTNVLVFPDITKRWKNHRKRESMGHWAPNEILFNLENTAYKKALTKIPIIINGNLPDISFLNLISKHYNKKNKNNNIYAYT
jgi:hypothetical protein